MGVVQADVANRLEAEGFRKEGRHWIHEKGQLFDEFPSVELDPEDKTATLNIGGVRVLTLKPEALIVDRLAAWQFWRSGVDGANAYLIWRGNRDRLDRSYLTRLARGRKTEEALRRLLSFGKRFARRAPSQEELEEWAETKF